MVSSLADPKTRDAALRGAAGLGAFAVVAVGVPMAELHTDRQQDANEWRLKARAFVEADGVAEDAVELDRTGVRFASLTQRAEGYADRVVTAGFESFSATHFDLADRQRDDMECLSRAIYYEARNEPIVGQLAVAEVVLNRVRHRLYPNNVCGVVYEGSHRTTGCQFTFTCDGAESNPPAGRTWARARLIAEHSLMGLSRPVTNEATHYHANYVSPYWAPRLTHTRTIGTHIFYRFKRPGDASAKRGA